MDALGGGSRSRWRARLRSGRPDESDGVDNAAPPCAGTARAEAAPNGFADAAP